MGGHGGLNILPQKSWNVYNRSNQEKVKRDEARHEREQARLRREEAEQEQKNRIKELRVKNGLPAEPEVHFSLFEQEEKNSKEFELEKKRKREVEKEKMNWLVKFGGTELETKEKMKKRHSQEWFARGGVQGARAEKKEERTKLRLDPMETVHRLLNDERKHKSSEPKKRNRQPSDEEEEEEMRRKRKRKKEKKRSRRNGKQKDDCDKADSQRLLEKMRRERREREAKEKQRTTELMRCHRRSN